MMAVLFLMSFLSREQSYPKIKFSQENLNMEHFQVSIILIIKTALSNVQDSELSKIVLMDDLSS